jgi:hypothetical protein
MPGAALTVARVLAALSLGLNAAACGSGKMAADGDDATDPATVVDAPVPAPTRDGGVGSPDVGKLEDVMSEQTPPDTGMTIPVDAALPVAGDDLPPCERTVPVTTSATLATAIGGAQPGDCITLADGSYTFPMITAKGTEAAPIVIRAEHVLKALVSSGDVKMQGAAYVVVEGLTFNGQGTIWMTDTDHGRISRFRIQRTESGPQQSFHDLAWITVFNSKYCRVDHNDFGPQNQHGNMILVTGTEMEPLVMAQHTRIDHNHFHDVHFAGGNGWETIRSGADTYSFTSAFTVIEQNLFVKDANDPEVVSIKSSDNIVRSNTIRASVGQFVLRHGNRNELSANYVLADGEGGAMGLRINGGQHKIFNNYVEGVKAPGIWLEGGNSNDTGGILQDHKQVYKTDVVFNTVVNAGGISVGGSHPLDPTDCNVAYNVMQGSGGVSVTGTSKNIKVLGNLASSGSAGAGVMVADPKLMKVGEVFTIGPGSPAINAGMGTFSYVSLDITGKARDSMPDLGANEVSTEPAKLGPLTAADVGPMAP